MVWLIQSSFTGGELAPSLHARVDLAKYANGLKRCRNFMVHAHGGVSNRPGLKFVAEAKHRDRKSRLIEFAFNTTQTYALEFGDQYMRVHKDGGQVIEDAIAITGATHANPVVVSAAGHGYADGDEGYIADVGGMTEINRRNFRVANVTADTLELQDLGGNGIDGTRYGTYTPDSGTVSRVYEIATPYLEAEIPYIKFTQSADVLSLVHPSHEVRELSRTGHAAWSLDLVTFAPKQASPVNVAVNPKSTGSETYHYKVTAVAEETGEESLVGFGPSSNVSGATQANPVVVTIGSHPIKKNAKVTMRNVGGMTQLNDNEYIVTAVSGTTITLEVNGSEFTAYTSGGTAQEENGVTINNGNSEPENTISWNAAAKAEQYNVYKYENGLYGFIGSSEELEFTDDNIEADTTDTPPKERNPFDVPDSYPSTVAYHEQRRVFAATDDDPQTVWTTKTGAYNNMTTSSPSKSADAITFTIASNQVNRVRHIISLNDMILLTSGGEWRVDPGSNSDALAFDSLRVKPQGYRGASEVAPLIIGNTVLFVQEKGAIVRDLAYALESDGYTGNDLSILSNHLFEGLTIDDWAYAQAPHSIVWCVRSDGMLLGLTYMREHEVWGWHRHETDGLFESVCSISEGQEDAAYVIVKRTIGGVTKRCIERFHNRFFATVKDAFFVDSGLTLDNPIAITGATQVDPVVVTAPAHGFANADLVDIDGVEGMTDINATRQTIANVTEDTFELINTEWIATGIDGATRTNPVNITAAGHGLSDGDKIAIFNVSGMTELNGRSFTPANMDADTFDLFSTDRIGDGITQATRANPVVITAAGHGLSDGDTIAIFDVSGMTELNGKSFTVANAAADTIELSGVDGTGYATYRSGGDIHTAIDGTGHGEYTSGGRIHRTTDGTGYSAYVSGGKVREQVTTISGLWHLEGATLVALADGNVVHDLTVDKGTVTLPTPAGRVHVGLPYTWDLETLNIDVATPSGTLQGRKKSTGSLVVRVHNTRGLWVGPGEERLGEYKDRALEAYGDPIALKTGDIFPTLIGDWDTDGRVFLRGVDPLPATILAIIQDVEFGG